MELFDGLETRVQITTTDVGFTGVCIHCITILLFCCR